MDYAGLKQVVLLKSRAAGTFLAEKLSESDPVVIAIAGLLVLFVVTVVALLAIKQISHSDNAFEYDDSVDLSGASDVIVRDLVSKLSNFQTQIKDEQLYLKQELKELKSMFGEFQRFKVIEDHIQSLNTRVSSYAALIREEYGELKEDLRVTKNVLSESYPELAEKRKRSRSKARAISRDSVSTGSSEDLTEAPKDHISDNQVMIHQAVPRSYIFGENQ